MKSNDTLEKAVEELKNTRGPKVVTKEITDLINQHAIGAAACGLASGWVPGVGSTVALVAGAGIVLSMYYRINECVGVKLSKTLLKSLSAFVLTVIAGDAMMAIVGSTVVGTALSFIPGIGSVGASVIRAGANYAILFVSGLIYVKLLTGLFKAGKDPSKLTEEQIKEAIKAVIEKEDIDAMIKEAKDDYMAAKKSGKIKGDEKIELIDEDDESSEKAVCKCGTQLEVGMKFCSNCGKKIKPKKFKSAK